MGVLFYWIISLSGLAVALFMYWNIVGQYHKNRLKPLRDVGILSLLLGMGLGLFNHFLSKALSGVESGLELGIRIAFVFMLSWLAWFLFRQAKNSLKN